MAVPTVHNAAVASGSSFAMYQQYFGLREPPFSIAVNPRYLFMSPRHRDALAHLLYGVGSGGGFILLTGEVGTGKTTINRCLLEQLPENTDLAIVLNPALSAVELLATVCDELGIDYPAGTGSLKTLTDALHRFLLDNHGSGRKTVLLIDEAQHLDFDVLEQIRLLTNLETNDEKLLQIILIGQPELTEKLARPELRQLNQRITARYTLEPLNVDETAAYIRHRLDVAGLPGGRELFPAAVVRDIHRRTRGIPRLINLLCDRTLLGAYGRKLNRVDRSLVRAASSEVLGDQAGADRLGRSVWLGAALVVLITVALVAAYQANLFDRAPAPVTAPESARGGAKEAMAATGQPGAMPERVVTPAGSPGTASAAPDWLLPPDRAERMLWRLSSDDPFPSSLCAAPAALRLRCTRAEAAVWDAVAVVGRPVLLDMVTPARFAATALVVDVTDGLASVLSDAGLTAVPLADLAQYWSGGYRYLWQPPANWTGPLQVGDQGPMVRDVARMFAELDDQTNPLTTDRFSETLATRVRLFQDGEGLTADGIVGEQTLQRLLLRLDRGLTSARARARLAALPAGLGSS